MKKQNMIKAIQNKEAELFLIAKQSEVIFGDESGLTKRDRSRWVAVAELMEELGIEPDIDHPAHTEVFKLSCKTIFNCGIISS